MKTVFAPDTFQGAMAALSASPLLSVLLIVLTFAAVSYVMRDRRVSSDRARTNRAAYKTANRAKWRKARQAAARRAY